MGLAAARAATRDLHRALEADVDPERIFASLDGYRDFLTRLHRFHGAAAPQVAAAAALLPDLPPAPPRVARLEADLRALGVAPTTASDASAAAAAAVDLPSPLDADHAAGLVYGVEGSALGGAVLARMARKRLGLEAATGASFFTGDAGDLGPRWKRVAAAIDRHDAAGVVAGAVATFAAMRAVLVDDPAPAPAA
ncbi:MAG: biliverdin-producing heme oxygenase [Solirubrobacteraceae bacterium]|nr:biliverdin-producing heme oxygenase [Patulibacter sp.]